MMAKNQPNLFPNRNDYKTPMLRPFSVSLTTPSQNAIEAKLNKMVCETPKKANKRKAGKKCDREIAMGGMRRVRIWQ